MPGSTSDFYRTLAVLREGIDQRLCSGAQVFVGQSGRTLLDEAVGEATPGTPVTPRHLVLWMSSVKPVTAVAVALLWQEGALDLDDPVARHIPEFAAGGKQRVTLRHVLTHMGGFRAACAPNPPDPWDAIIAQICAAKLEPSWTLGEKAGYHPSSGWFILGEVVQRLTGTPFDRFVRQRIFLPLGMDDCFIGMSGEEYDARADRLASFHRSEDGNPAFDAAPPSREQCAVVRPASIGRGPMRQLARLYAMLLGRGTLGGARLLTPQTVEAMIARQRAGLFDHTFKHVVDFGLGLIVNSAQYGAETVPYGFGPHASRRTFGHGGMQSSCAFADPEHGLVVAWHANATPGDARHERRLRALNAAIYEDAGLVG